MLIHYSTGVVPGHGTPCGWHVYHTPCSSRYLVNDVGLKPKSRSTESRSVVLSKEKRVIAAFVSGGLGNTASITAAPTPTNGVGAYALMRVLCIACNKALMTSVNE